MSNDRNIIRIENLVKSFVLPHETISAIKECNVVIPENSFTIIFGPSGSGKSTLLDAITGLEKPTGGKVIFKDTDLYSMSADSRANFRANNLGMVYQTNYWVTSLSVLDNVCMPLYLSGYMPHQARAIAMSYLKQVNVDHLANQRPGVLSTGEQQRVSMARALVSDPEVIVADEPTGNLDTHNGDVIMGLLLKLQKDFKKTVILVTHNLEYLPMSTHRISVRDGKVAVDDSQYGLSSKIKARLTNVMNENAKSSAVLNSSEPQATSKKVKIHEPK